MSLKEASETEKRLWEQGGSGYEIIKKGVRYKVTKDGLIPITGPQAQQIIKQQRRQRKKKGNA